MFVERLQIVINKKIFIIVLLLLVIVVSLLNENILLNKSTYKINSSQIKEEGIKITILAPQKNGYVVLVPLDNVCEKYIMNKNISFSIENNKLNILNALLEDKKIIKIFKDKQVINNCQFNVTVFKKQPNPLLPLFLIYIPTIIIFYVLFKIVVIHFRT
jgi:hypothetical protein